MPDWYPRFGDIPGVSFETPADVDRSSLAGHGAVPELHAFEFDGELHESLWWPEGGGGTSASPAHRYAFGDVDGASPRELVHGVHEALELPGEPSDYHFLLQGCATRLWSLRRDDPSVLEDVERLCWLDLQLVQARPEAVTNDRGDETGFYSIPTFSILTDLYEREGFLDRARAVAELAARYGQGDASLRSIESRLAAVAGETR